MNISSAARHHTTTGSPGSPQEYSDMDPTQNRLYVHDHLAALEAEAGIERLIRDLRDARDRESRGSQPGRGLRAAIGRGIIAVGSAIAATPREEPCPDAADASFA
jgi:imidazolonepropionase-like amidohydrolase